MTLPPADEELRRLILSKLYEWRDIPRRERTPLLLALAARSDADQDRLRVALRNLAEEALVHPVWETLTKTGIATFERGEVRGVTSDQFFRLCAADGLWGDYGLILVHGMAARNGWDEHLELERTGPFVPPISFPDLQEIIVTDAFREIMTDSGLTGISFESVVKAKITRVDWPKWDPEKPKLPGSGEPEDYIMKRKHSPETAAEMGELWGLQLAPVVKIELSDEARVISGSWDGTDFFTDRFGWRWKLVSRRAREWLEREVPKWVRFAKVAVC